MMATTHGFVGMALSVPLLSVAPELAPAAAVGGLAGGLFPDLDMGFEHRRTLHYPDYYWVPTLLVGAVAIAVPGPLTVALALFFLAAAVHSVSDVFGGGLELRPWLGTSEKAVYLHHQRRWIAPRRGVRYDGAPEDLALAVVFAVPPMVAYEGYLRTVAVAGVAVSVVYALVRKRLPDWAPERFL